MRKKHISEGGNGSLYIHIAKTNIYKKSLFPEANAWFNQIRDEQPNLRYHIICFWNSEANVLFSSRDISSGITRNDINANLIALDVVRSLLFFFLVVYADAEVCPRRSCAKFRFSGACPAVPKSQKRRQRHGVIAWHECSQGFPREFSRGNYFSFSAAAVYQIDSPRSAGHVSRGNIAQVLYSFLLLNIPGNEDKCGASRTILRANWPATFRPCFFFPRRHQSVPRRGAPQDECARSRRRRRIPSRCAFARGFLAGSLAADSTLRGMKYGRTDRQSMYDRSEAGRIAEQLRRVKGLRLLAAYSKW